MKFSILLLVAFFAVIYAAPAPKPSPQFFGGVPEVYSPYYAQPYSYSNYYSYPSAYSGYYSDYAYPYSYSPYVF